MRINSAFHGRPIACVRYGKNRLPVGANHLRQLEKRAGSTRAESPASFRLETDRRQAPFRERQLARFGFVTGYEVYRPDPYDNEFVTRRTYGVGVFIWRDPHSPRGFRVRTAYPMNFD